MQNRKVYVKKNPKKAAFVSCTHVLGEEFSKG